MRVTRPARQGACGSASTRPSRAGADRQGRLALPPPRLRHRRHRSDARLLDHLARHGRWLGWGPARHGVGGNIASYVRIVEEDCFVELYCDMEQLQDDHEPRDWPDDRFSSNTWGPLPPRSYFRFDPTAVEWERESLRDAGRAAAAPRRDPPRLLLPRSPEGRSSLVPHPPWHYVGDFLVIEYWADPAAALSVLPPGLEPHPDPGRCAAVFADWQSCSERGGELLDPSRSQYKEFFIVVNALLDGEEVTTCPSSGSIATSPSRAAGCRASRRSSARSGSRARSASTAPPIPGLRPGAVFGGTCAAYERRVAEAHRDARAPHRVRPDAQRPAASSTCGTSRGSSRPPRRSGRARARLAHEPRPRRSRRSGRAARRSSSSALRTRNTTRSRPRDRQGIPVHVRLHRRRPGDREGPAA